MTRTSLILPMLLMLLMLGHSHGLHADDEESGFDIPLGAGWTEFDPYGNASAMSSGGTLSLSAPAPPDLETAYILGPARVAVLTEVDREDTQISAEVTSWPATTNRAIDGTFVAVMSRGRDTDGFAVAGEGPAHSPDGPQPAVVASYVDGYSLSFIDLGNGSARLQLHRIDDEVPILIAPLPGEPYADFSLAGVSKIGLVLSSRGDDHYGEARDLTPGTGGPFAVASVSATDATYEDGRAGVLVTTDRLIPVSAGFDHVLVWDAWMPQPAVRRKPAEGWFELVADRRRATALGIESCTDLSDPEDPWGPAPPDAWAYEGDNVVFRYATEEPRRFFRFVSE